MCRSSVHRRSIAWELLEPEDEHHVSVIFLPLLMWMEPSAALTPCSVRARYQLLREVPRGAVGCAAVSIRASYHR